MDNALGRKGTMFTGEALKAMIGQEVGVSGWSLIDQARIDAFAEVTEDRQFIHVDPEAAKMTPFGGTIAHGFLTLAMLSKMAYEAAPVLDGVKMGVNYGFDRIRFLQPVKSGQRIRGRFKLKDVVERHARQWLITYEVSVEIEGESKPALTAEWLGLQVTG
jgi:acyl dehydratase